MPVDLDKLIQYNEFFSIAHSFTLNITPMANDALPDFDEFIAQMPLPFQMASETAQIDQSALRSIRGLGDSAAFLAELINYQSQKIDMLINYILSQQDDEQSRYQGTAFGGGGLSFVAEQAFNLGDKLELKVFILDANCAVYCLGEVVEVQVNEQDYSHKVIFHFIREQDRESLVRASLQEQSRQLKALSKQRNEQTNQRK